MYVYRCLPIWSIPISSIPTKIRLLWCEPVPRKSVQQGDFLSFVDVPPVSPLRRMLFEAAGWELFFHLPKDKLWSELIPQRGVQWCGVVFFGDIPPACWVLFCLGGGVGELDLIKLRGSYMRKTSLNGVTLHLGGVAV